MTILDASALLAVIRKEKGGEKILHLLKNAEDTKNTIFIHAINFIELAYKCRRLYGNTAANQILTDMQSPYLGIINYLDTDLNLYAAHLKAGYHLSLADAIGLAHTKIMKATFWTADIALKSIAEKESIFLQCIR